MDDYSIPEILLTAESFKNSDWRSVVENSQGKECWQYAIQFIALTEGNRLSHDYEKLLAHQLLYELCKLPPCFDSQSKPFQKNGYDGFEVISSLCQEYIDALSNCLEEIDDAELQSRIADVVWIRTRNHKVAKIAVDAYLSSSEYLAQVNNPTTVSSRVERAIQIAAGLGKKGDLYKNSKIRIEGLIDQWLQQDRHPCTKILSICGDHSIGDPLKWADLSFSLASHFSSYPQWDIYRKYLELAAKFYAKCQIFDKEKAILRASAESYLAEVEEIQLSPQVDHFSIVNLLKKAKKAFAVKDLFTPEEIECQKFSEKIVAHQKLSALSLSGYGLELPSIGENTEKAIKLVKGKSFHDAILSIATFLNPMSVEELKRLLQISGNSLFPITPKSLINRQGRIIGQSSPIFSDNSQEEDIVKRNELLKHLNFNLNFHQARIVQEYLYPIIQQINSEHFVRLEDWIPILGNNPVVPSGREAIYAMGLQSGLNGNWIESVHLLVPQLENSIRYILANHGVITFRWGSDNEDDFPLSKILYQEEVKKIFGEDLTFHLKCLLLERFGSNLRNVIAHGLADIDFLISWRSIYLWWICLYILCSPRISSSS